jgi:hypothetical protein
MACESCIQKILATNEAEKKILKMAIQKAKETGHWYAIYTNEYGQSCLISAADAAATGIPVKRYISPNNTNTAV